MHEIRASGSLEASAGSAANGDYPLATEFGETFGGDPAVTDERVAVAGVVAVEQGDDVCRDLLGCGRGVVEHRRLLAFASDLECPIVIAACADAKPFGQASTPGSFFAVRLVVRSWDVIGQLPCRRRTPTGR